jgi:hypothetical protein
MLPKISLKFKVVSMIKRMSSRDSFIFYFYRKKENNSRIPRVEIGSVLCVGLGFYDGIPKIVRKPTNHVPEIIVH